jgi:hypothetical protein
VLCPLRIDAASPGLDRFPQLRNFGKVGIINAERKQDCSLGRGEGSMPTLHGL